MKNEYDLSKLKSQRNPFAATSNKPAKIHAGEKKDHSAVKIYHNPRCSKSRQTLALLRENGHEPEVVEYLKTPPTARELDAILKKLGIEPDALLRKKDAAYTELGLAGKDLPRDGLIQIMAENPSLIERPIVVHGNKAALGRPPENALNIL